MTDGIFQVLVRIERDRGRVIERPVFAQDKQATGRQGLHDGIIRLIGAGLDAGVVTEGVIRVRPQGDGAPLQRMQFIHHVAEGAVLGKHLHLTGAKIRDGRRSQIHRRRLRRDDRTGLGDTGQSQQT